MYRKILPLLISAAGALLPQAGLRAQYDHASDNTLRLMSYNIRNGCDMAGKAFQYAAQIGVISRQRPDVVAVEEVDSATQRSAGRFPLGEYAAALGMHYEYSPAISYQGGKYGIGILSREKPLSVKRIALPGREEARTALIAEFPRYVFAAAHLSLTDADRLSSVEILRAQAEAHPDKPFFIAGDFNLTPASEAGKLLAKYFRVLTDAKKPTYPADKPNSTIDYIAVYSGPRAADVVGLSRGVVNAPTQSDHRPVVTAVRFRTPAARLMYAEPYLQNFAADGVSVMFQTNAVVHAWVEYGEDTLHLLRARTLLAGQEPCFDIENKIRLAGLKPGRKYYYRVGMQEILQNQAYHKILGDTVLTPFHSFSLPADDARDFTAVVLNDLHENDRLMERLIGIAREKAGRYDMLFFNGDCLTEPYSREYAITRVNRLMTAAGAADSHVMAIRGNHEIRNSYSAGMLSLTDCFAGKTYGAFSWGDTRFVVLDCGEDKPDDTWVYYGLNDFTQLRTDQRDFLEQEVSSREFRRAKRHILIQHIPIWGGDNVYTAGFHPWTAMWEPALRRGKFDIDICAHAHSYYYYPAGSHGNPVPCYGGGGPSFSGAEKGTVGILRKRGSELRLTVYDADGQQLLDQQL